MRFKSGLLLLSFAVAWLPGAVFGEPATGKLTVGRRSIRKDAFNLRFALAATGQDAAGSEAEIYFHADSAGNGYRIKLASGAIRLGKYENRAFSLIKESVMELREHNTLLVKKRGKRIRVFLDDRAVLSAEDGAFSGGAFAWRSSREVSVSDGALQDVGDIYFADDFMRETRNVRGTTQRLQDHGAWTPVEGRWFVLGPGRPETSAAIFQLCCSGGGERFVYKAGYWFWENYIYAASVYLGHQNDLAALRFYDYSDAGQGGNYFTLQWTGRTGSLELVRVKDGRPAILASRSIAFLPKQWYRVKLMILGSRLRAYIDDAPVMNETLPGAVCGGIGLEAAGSDIRFDDVHVASLKLSEKDFADDSSPSLRGALQAAESLEQITEFFTRRPTMKRWATAEGAWESKHGIEWNDNIFYQGTVAWSPAARTERGTVALLLGPESGQLRRGYRLVCSFDETAGWRTTSVFKDGECLMARRDNKAAGKLAIEVSAGEARLLAGGRALLVDSPSTEYRGFCFGRSCRGDANKSVSVSTAKLLDYPFGRAPTDWIIRGTWELRPRWTCDDRFNWFSGRNRNGRAEIWNKHRFDGDYAVEAYIACMLLGNFPKGYAFPINFRITVAADQMKPGRGYTCLYGYVDQPTSISRNGAVVASDDSEVDATLWKDFCNARAEQVHRRWSYLKVQKKGDEVRFYVDRKLRLTFKDEEPLNGPYVCICTENNGIMVSRVKVTYDKLKGKELVTR